MLSINSLIDMFFFIISINVIFGLPLPFFRFLILNQITLFYWFITHSPLNMIEPTKATLQPPSPPPKKKKNIYIYIYMYLLAINEAKKFN